MPGTLLASQCSQTGELQASASLPYRKWVSLLRITLEVVFQLLYARSHTHTHTHTYNLNGTGAERGVPTLVTHILKAVWTLLS